MKHHPTPRWMSCTRQWITLWLWIPFCIICQRSLFYYI